MSHSGATEKASKGPGCCSFPTLQGVGAQDSTDSQGKASETALCPAGHGKDLLSPGAGLPVSVGCVAGHACSWLQAFELMDSCCISLNSVTRCKRMCAEMQLYPQVPKVQTWLTSMCPTQLRIINLDVKPVFMFLGRPWHPVLSAPCCNKGRWGEGVRGLGKQGGRRAFSFWGR